MKPAWIFPEYPWVHPAQYAIENNCLNLKIVVITKLTKELTQFKWLSDLVVFLWVICGRQFHAGEKI